MLLVNIYENYLFLYVIICNFFSVSQSEYRTEIILSSTCVLEFCTTAATRGNKSPSVWPTYNIPKSASSFSIPELLMFYICMYSPLFEFRYVHIACLSIRLDTLRRFYFSLCAETSCFSIPWYIFVFWFTDF